MDRRQQPPMFGGFPASPTGPPGAYQPGAYPPVPGAYPPVPVTYPTVPGGPLAPAPMLKVIDPVDEFMQGRQHPPLLQMKVADVPETAEGLQQLAKVWCWREAVAQCERCVANLRLLPHERLRWHHAQAFALVKLQSPDEVMEVLQKHVGAFDSGKNRYETYRQFYPTKTGSMIPFGLRLLYAKLPLLKNEPKQSQDRLYDLLEHCRTQCAHSSLSPSSEAEAVSSQPDSIEGIILREEDNSEAGWKDRERRVKLELVNTHLLLHQHSCAVAILNAILAEYTPSRRSATPTGQSEYMDLLQRLGGIHLEAGQTGPAEDAFDRVEAIDETLLCPADQRKLEVMQAINRGTLCMARSEYSDAYGEFKSVLRMDPGNVEAANNLAVCALYSCNLREAVLILEGLIRADPDKGLTEAVVFNLCTLYDLQSEQNTQKKKVLQAVVQRYRGNHFPQKYLKLE